MKTCLVFDPAAPADDLYIAVEELLNEGYSFKGVEHIPVKFLVKLEFEKPDEQDE